MNPEWLAVMRRSHKEAGGRGPRFPRRTRSQTPKGRFYQSPWQRTSSHPPPVSEGGGKTKSVRGQKKVSVVVNEDKKSGCEERCTVRGKQVSIRISEGGRLWELVG